MADKISWLGILLPLVQVFVLISYANSASFQSFQNLQNDPDYLMKNLQRLPSPDMIKALEYIESLRKQTSNIETSPDYSSYQNSPFVLQSKESKNQHYLPDNLRESFPEDDSQWVKTMLETIRQREKESKVVSKENKLNPLNSDNIFLDGTMDDYDERTWPATTHKKFKVPHTYFEENSRDNPYKRTNEIVEEQYTPQSLATLESVFQELGKMMAPHNLNKERFNEEQKLYADEEDDAFKGNNIAYEDVVGGEDWNPVEEKVESQTQEEIRDSKEEIEKNDEINDEIKRAGILEDDMKKENKNQVLEDVSQLMDYYLKKMMNRPGGDMLGINQNEDKRAAKYFEKQLDPQAVYELIEISRNLQIPPEDLIEMLKSGDKHQNEKEQEPELIEDIDEIPEINLEKSDLFKNKMNSLHGYQKQRFNVLPDNLPEDLNVEDIINLLEMENVGNQKPPYPGHQINQENGFPKWYLPARSDQNILSKMAWLNRLERQMKQESLNGKEEELSDYLAKMLTKYPEVINTGLKKEIPLAVSSERDHLDQIGSHEPDQFTLFGKRLPTAKENDGTQNRPYMDEEMLAKVLEYLNQDKSEKGKEHITKRAMENM